MICPRYRVRNSPSKARNSIDFSVLSTLMTDLNQVDIQDVPGMIFSQHSQKVAGFW